ncbi:cell division ATP-binding protein FtsE, partial [Stenotrophomonas maltophilia]
LGIPRRILGAPTRRAAEEPPGTLHPSLAAEIRALFAALPARGPSVLGGSHDLPLLSRMRKRVQILDHCRLGDVISTQDRAQ